MATDCTGHWLYWLVHNSSLPIGLYSIMMATTPNSEAFRTDPDVPADAGFVMLGIYLCIADCINMLWQLNNCLIVIGSK